MSDFETGLFKRPWVRYGMAVVAVAAGLLLRWAVTAQVGEGLPTYITFYPAVVVAALLAGLGPGFLATALTLVVVDWMVSPKALIWRLDHWHPDLVVITGMVLFSAMGVFLSVLAELYRRAREKTAAYEKELALRESQEELRRQREWLRVTLSSIGDAVVATDTAGRITLPNPAAEKLMGWTEREVLGQPVQSVLRIVNEETHAPADDLVGRVLREQRVVSLADHTALIPRDGRAIPVEGIAAPIKGSADTVSGAVVVFRDVTEKRGAYEAFRQAAEQHRLALDAGKLGTWDYNFVTGDVFWDERCRTLFGVVQGDRIAYERAIAKIHEADRQDVDRAVQAALAPDSSGVYGREYRVVWPDRSVHWVASKGQAYFQGEGSQRKPVRFIGTVQDITERKQTEKALTFLTQCGLGPGEDFFHSLARYLAENLDMDFVCIDRLEGDALTAQTVAVFFEGKFQDNTSYALKDTPCGEVVGQTVCCFPSDVRHRFPKDVVLQDMLAESYVGVTLRKSTGQPIGLIAVIGRRRLPNPQLAESLLQLVAGRAAGELERTLAEEALIQARAELERTVEKRTAELRATNARLREEIEAGQRKQKDLTEAELRYSTVADFTYDWEYWKKPDGVLVYCSPSCERITGYTAGELVDDPKLLAGMVHPEDRDNWQQHDCDALAEPGAGTVALRIQRKDGRIRWIEHTCHAVIGSGGEPLGVRASNRDITDRKIAEIETQHLRQELARASRITTAGQLAAALAHELNQPLGAIVCNAQAAEEYLGQAPPALSELREIVRDIEADGQRAGNVIHRLRALYQKTGQERAVLQLNKVIENTIELLRSEFVLKGVSLQLDLDATLPAVSGDYFQLQQVVINLILNALDAMAAQYPGSRCLRISTGCWEPNTVRVSLRDSGTGLSAEQPRRMGEPFFTTKPTGMGMGLAISRSIAEAHGGRLWAENNPDRGATLHVALPVFSDSSA